MHKADCKNVYTHYYANRVFDKAKGKPFLGLFPARPCVIIDDNFLLLRI